MKIEEAAFEPENKQSVVKPYVLSHGTLEVFNLQKSRRFYEEFLGPPMRAPRQARHGRSLRHEIPHRLHRGRQRGASLQRLNHWGVDVGTRVAVEEAYKNAKALKEKYEIRQITDPVLQHGVYSFYIEDLDHNWWEVQHYDGFQHDDMFEFGDVFPPEEAAGTDHMAELEPQPSK